MTLLKMLDALTPSSLQQIIDLQKDFLERKFPEHKKSSKKGAKLVGLFWVIALLCILAKASNLTWRELPVKLEPCEFLIQEGYLRRIPHYSTFNRYWNMITIENLETWIARLGYEVSKDIDTDTAVDSSGFKITLGKMWRFLKWDVQKLTKNSKLFKKAHIQIGIQSRAVLAAIISDANYHDFYILPKVWKRCYNRLYRQFKRFHADKAYWDKKWIAKLDKLGINVVIPVKKNLKDHGSDNYRDRLIRLQRKHKAIYKKNYKPHLRAEVEHVFGQITIYAIKIQDKKQKNKKKTLLIAFLRYNMELYAQKVKHG